MHNDLGLTESGGSGLHAGAQTWHDRWLPVQPDAGSALAARELGVVVTAGHPSSGARTYVPFDGLGGTRDTRPRRGDDRKGIACMLMPACDPAVQGDLPGLVREFASLLDDTDTIFVLFRSDGLVDACAGCPSAVSSIHELFDAGTVCEMERLVTARALAAPVAVDGNALDGTRLAIRLMESPVRPGVLAAFVRTARTASEDELLARLRGLRAALQEVVDTALRSQEVRATDSRRRRAQILGMLTERERLVASGIADGRRSAQIAESLFVSDSTVRNYLSSIYRKLGIQSQAELIELLRGDD